MPFLHVVVLAALQGLSEALPISRSGHGAVAQLFLEPPGNAAALEAVLHLGTALALGVVSHQRLFAALGEGVRAIARPALFQASPGARDAALLTLGVTVSLSASLFTAPFVEPFCASPLAAGVGLVVTGAALASTRLAPRAGDGRGQAERRRGHGEPPSALGMALVGLAHGLAVFPGASRVGAALVLLLWLGVRPARALDLAFLLTVPSLLVAFAQSAFGLTGAPGLEAPVVIVGLVLAFVAATLASAALRALLTQRRVSALALWILPLGLAMMAYARALPHPSSG